MKFKDYIQKLENNERIEELKKEAAKRINYIKMGKVLTLQVMKELGFDEFKTFSKEDSFKLICDRIYSRICYKHDDSIHILLNIKNLSNYNNLTIKIFFKRLNKLWEFVGLEFDEQETKSFMTNRLCLKIIDYEK